MLMLGALLDGKNIIGAESVEYTFEPFKTNVYERPSKKPIVVKGSPQLRTVRINGIIPVDKVDDVQSFEEISKPVAFSSPVVSLSQCVLKQIRMTQSGNSPISYTIELQEVDEFIEVGNND